MTILTKDEEKFLFDREGFITAHEYLRDIDILEGKKEWRLPVRFIDRVHVFMLRVFIRYSWFSDRIYISHHSVISPGYDLLVRYLKKCDYLDLVVEVERDLQATDSLYSFQAVKHLKGEGRDVTGQGVAATKSQALSIALGELLERMITGIHDKNDKIITEQPKILETNSRVLYPPKFHRFLPVQVKKYSFLRISSSTPLDWVEGEDLISREKVYIPKSMTSWFRATKKNNYILFCPTSNGSAGHFSKTGATLRGLLEYVQRDGFLVHWLTQTAPQVVDCGSLPSYLQEMIYKARQAGLTIYILNTTALAIPTVVVIAINNESDIPHVAMSSSSDLTYVDAIYGALKEITVVFTSFYLNQEKEYSKPYQQFSSVYSQVERQRFWIGKEKIKLLEWFLSGEVISYGELAKNDLVCGAGDNERLQICLKMLQNFGDDYHPVVYYPKNELQEKLNFYTAQVFIPKAFPFYLYEDYGTFDSDRLKEFAQCKGKIFHEAYKLPHMFS